jgi:hypothetical protein
MQKMAIPITIEAIMSNAYTANICYKKEKGGGERIHEIKH